MKIYAVIDTNVIVSALLSCHQDSATVKILDHLYDRTIIPVYNDEILNEYAVVLRRPKFKFSEVTINATLEAIKKGGMRSDSKYGEYYYPEDLRSFYLLVNYHYKDRKIISGNAYRLPEDGWSL